MVNGDTAMPQALQDEFMARFAADQAAYGRNDGAGAALEGSADPAVLQAQLAAAQGPDALARRALELRAGYAGERPFAPDIPAPGDFSQGPTAAPPMSIGDRLRAAFLSGGAGDIRNVLAGAAPAGLSMALARAANPTAQVLQRGGVDLAEQMFDLSRPAPVMGAAGALAAGGAVAGEEPTANALKLPRGVSFADISRDAAKFSNNVDLFVQKYGMLPEQAMDAWEDRQTRNPPFYKRPFVSHPDDLPRKAPGKQSMSLDGAQFAKRYEGAGPRRDKKLRDAEDAATS